MDLIADIGATNSRCALLDRQGHRARTGQYENRDYPDLDTLLRQFLGDTTIERAALAVAGPIAGDEIELLNIDWRFNRLALAQSLGVAEVAVMNDFEALALALPRLDGSHCRQIGGGHALAGRPKAVLGPGSGLGVASVVPAGGDWIPVGGEGGHVSLPALDETERRIVDAYRDTSGHCSAERLLSGPGLTRIHSVLAGRPGGARDEITPATVTARAIAGDPLACQTYEVFFALLGTVAGNLALTVGARGGVFIAGGIVPRVVEALAGSAFRRRFIGKGRYRDYLDAIPTYVITTELPAFIGLGASLGFD